MSRNQEHRGSPRHAYGETVSGARNLPDFLCSLLKPGPVLVVGASPVAVEAARRHEVTVAEWSEDRVQALDDAAREAGCTLRVMQRDPSRHELGLPARSFPNIVCLDVLERFPDDVAVLEKLHRILEPGGRFVVRVPARPWSRGSATESTGARRYDPRSLRGVLEEAGFRPLRVRHWNAIGVPAALLGRSAPSDGLSRGTGFWDSVLDLWYRTIEKRVGFPVGVSLVALATPHLEKASVRRPALHRPLGRGRQAYEPMTAAR